MTAISSVTSPAVSLVSATKKRSESQAGQSETLTSPEFNPKAIDQKLAEIRVDAAAKLGKTTNERVGRTIDLFA